MSGTQSQLRLLWSQAALDQDAELILNECETLCSGDLTSFERYLAATVAAELASRTIPENADANDSSNEATTEKYLSFASAWLEQAVAQDDSTDFHVRIPRLLDHPSFAAFQGNGRLRRAVDADSRL